MSLALTVLYRGPLKSCDYGCAYCPFAKRAESPEALEEDRAALRRLVAWAEGRPASDRLGVFFIPWGEALVRPWYREAICALSRLPQVVKVAAQTNLSAPVDWIRGCDPARVGLWTTYHPEWSDLDEFAERIEAIRRSGIAVSVGVVGFKRHEGAIVRLRQRLPGEVYLWINAVKSPWGPRREHPPERYSAEDVARLESIDPRFGWTLREHPSKGRSCRTGASVVAVDGEGTMRRCPFVPEVIGNLYEPGFERALSERPCPNATCGCHIGYVHLEHLGLREVYGDGILERVPRDWAHPASAARISHS